MRIAPVGAHFADDAARLVPEAIRSARVTHSHPAGIAGAVGQAAAVAAAVRGDDPLAAAIATTQTEPLRSRLERARVGRAERWPADRVAAELGNGVEADRSVPAAVFSACAASSFEAACTFAVRVGGDADTIAAMAGAIAGGRFGASAIPERWLRGLEDGPRGRSYVEQLARGLWSSD